MTDFEKALLTKIITERDIRTVIKQKVVSDFFFDVTSRSRFAYLLQWYKNPEYADTPSWESFMHTFPDFEPVEVDDSVVALCDKLREQKLYQDQANVVQEWSRVISSDPIEAFNYLKTQTVRLTSEHTVDGACDIRNRLDEVRAEYLAMKEGHTGLKGKPWPWPALNEATLGCRDGHLIFFYGRPKTKKTWITLSAMHNFVQYGEPCLIMSQELPEDEIIRRFVAIDCCIDYDKFLRGELNAEEENQFFDGLDAFHNHPPIIVSTLTGMGEDCLVELEAAIDEYGARKVLIDGANYLGEDTKQIGSVVRGFKRIAKAKKLAIIGSAHQNRVKNKSQEYQAAADDFYGSDTYYQSCDLAIRITAEIENRRKREVMLWTAAIREGKSTLFSVNMILCSNMTQKEMVVIGDSDNDVDEEIAQDEVEAAAETEQADEPMFIEPMVKPPHLVNGAALKPPHLA